ncbi:ISAzo13-like element transposase-related protein [Phenylobacterium sp.]|uniref:ISAzo13-like element transposase-related protein n=1 Tax=Phenylobacterium sp. TaxID=1871053 RepID=UPI003982EC43
MCRIHGRPQHGEFERRQALIDEKSWTSEQLPHTNSIGEILNRLGFKLRRVQNSKPLKKVRETDAIFQNVLQENRASDVRQDSLRISIDSKANLDFGEFSRGGVLRAATASHARRDSSQILRSHLTPIRFRVTYFAKVAPVTQQHDDAP